MVKQLPSMYEDFGSVSTTVEGRKKVKEEGWRDHNSVVFKLSFIRTYHLQNKLRWRSAL